jgi:hypothetical protein
MVRERLRLSHRYQRPLPASKSTNFVALGAHSSAVVIAAGTSVLFFACFLAPLILLNQIFGWLFSSWQTLALRVRVR